MLQSKLAESVTLCNQSHLAQEILLRLRMAAVAIGNGTTPDKEMMRRANRDGAGRPGARQDARDVRLDARGCLRPEQSELTMSDKIQVTKGPYCGKDCPAWGMWDPATAYCDVFEQKTEIHQGVGTVRCDQCRTATQEEWYPAFSAWREAFRKQDADDEAAGKKPGRYLRKEYRPAV